MRDDALRCVVMRAVRAQTRSGCPRCAKTIHPRQMIIRAFDLGAFVHLDCMRPPRTGDLQADGLAGGFTIGFTGSRQVTGQAERLMGRWLDGLRADAFVTGACLGVDVIAGRYLRRRYPDAHHLVVVPANRAAVRDWWTPLGDVDVLEMPADSTYRDRNEAIVMLADSLVAFVAAPEEDLRSLRSGTWQTVRIARKLQVPITYMDLGAPTHWTHTPPPAPAPAPILELPEELF